MIDFAVYTFAIYAITFLIVSSHIFHSVRERLKEKFPFLSANNVHLLDCRMCVGFWVSFFAWLLAFGAVSVSFMLGVYGASYFLATQER